MQVSALEMPCAFDRSSGHQPQSLLSRGSSDVRLVTQQLIVQPGVIKDGGRLLIIEIGLLRHTLGHLWPLDLDTLQSIPSYDLSLPFLKSRN